MCIIQLTAQDQDLKIIIEPDTVSVGQLFKIKFEIQNINADIDIADWDESLQYYGQPSISNRTSIINNVMTTSKEYIFTIQANKIGVFPISGSVQKPNLERIERSVQITVVSELPDQLSQEKPEDDLLFKQRDPNELRKYETKKKRKIYKL